MPAGAGRGSSGAALRLAADCWRPCPYDRRRPQNRSDPTRPTADPTSDRGGVDRGPTACRSSPMANSRPRSVLLGAGESRRDSSAEEVWPSWGGSPGSPQPRRSSSWRSFAPSRRGPSRWPIHGPIALRVNQGLSAQQSQSVATGLDLAAARSARWPTVRSQNYNFLLSNTPGVKSPLTSTSAGGSSGAGSPLAGLPAFFHVLGPNQTDLPISFTFASLPLYTGGRLMRNIDAAGEPVRAADRGVPHGARPEADGRRGLRRVLRAQRYLEVAQSNVEQLASFARDMTNRREQGLAIRSDELAAEVSLANAQLAEIQARTALETAWATYNRYLCRPLGTVVELDELRRPRRPPTGSELADGPSRPAPSRSRRERRRGPRR